jgi:hypothetical protein
MRKFIIEGKVFETSETESEEEGDQSGDREEE